MGRSIEAVRTINSFLRTLLFGVLVIGASIAGWKGYAIYNEPQIKLAEKQTEVDQLQKKLSAREEELLQVASDLEKKSEQLDRAETSMRLLKLNHRIARLRVIDQQKAADSNRVTTTIEFYEVDEAGFAIDDRRREFTLEGDRVYVECLVVKFEDKYIEEADLQRSTAICLFQRIFGEYQNPEDGFLLDEVGSSLSSFAGSDKVSEFEQSIWDDFWEIAGDRKKAAAIGIRAAHADAPSTRVRNGVTYELELRSTGEFTLRPLPEEEAGILAVGNFDQ